MSASATNLYFKSHIIIRMICMQVNFCPTLHLGFYIRTVHATAVVSVPLHHKKESLVVSHFVVSDRSVKITL